MKLHTFLLVLLVLSLSLLGTSCSGESEIVSSAKAEYVEAKAIQMMVEAEIRQVIDQARVKEAEAVSTAGSPQVIEPQNQLEQRLFLQYLGIPSDFLPTAEKLVYLDIGALEIDGPAEMKVGETQIFTAKFRLDQNLFGGSDSSVYYSAIADDFRFSKVLHATSNGIDFEISPSGDDTQPQIVLPGQELIWVWQVRAFRRGPRLPLTFQFFTEATDEIEGTPRIILLMPSETKYVNVTQSTLEVFANNPFVKDLFVALIGSSAVAALIVYFLDRKMDDRLKKLENAHNDLAKTQLNLTRVVATMRRPGTHADVPEGPQKESEVDR